MAELWLGDIKKKSLKGQAVYLYTIRDPYIL